MATTTPPRSWPANNSRNLYAVHPSLIGADFESERERLFIPDESDDEVNITITELPCSSSSSSATSQSTFHNTAQVLNYIREREQRPPPSPHTTTTTTTIIQINQTFSWGELEITSTALQALFTHFDISPGFWPVLKLFGSKDSDEHEAAGGFNELVRSDGDGAGASFEISYTAKHAEEHHRPERAAYNPWSIRQIGVDYKHDAARAADTLVLVNPSQALTERIAGLGRGADMLEAHRLVMCAVTERWGQYLAHLEGVCKHISKRAVLAKGPRKLAHYGFEVHFSDSQRIRDLQDTVNHVSHMLDLNLSIFEYLLASTDLFISHGGASSQGTKASIMTLAAQTRLWKVHVESLLRRLDGSAVLVSSILDAKSLETLMASSGATAELTALAREDALKAKQEARTLNTITILGFIYLPASFVATLLGTQYINIHDSEGGKVSITFAREMWIFVILTLILLAVTAGTWRFWERRNRLADRSAMEGLGKGC